MFTGDLDSLAKNIGLSKEENTMELKDAKKQEKVENIYYIKSHLDLVVVSLAIIYLVYQIRQVSKQK
jgi:hypothetical protein